MCNFKQLFMPFLHKMKLSVTVWVLLIFVIILNDISCILLQYKRKCGPLIFQNGQARIMSKGRTARLKCKPGYQLIGDKYATCLRGQWDAIPICVKSGCVPLPMVSNGQMVESYRGAVLKLYCNPGYTLSGSSFIYCDGNYWNDTDTNCIATEKTAQTWCDFETPDLCGWTQDPHHNFDWSRQNFRTPSGNVGTGPSYDHTLGPDKDGHYMFIESSSPRMENDTARLYSPVYPAYLSTGFPFCFIFWYHMYGATTGTLNVYIKLENSEFGSGISPKFTKSGDQGNRWIQAIVILSVTLENFQMIIEAVRGDGYVSDIAIDDVRIGNGSDCLIPKKSIWQTTSESDDQNGANNDITEHSQSCKLRCARNNGSGTTVETPMYGDCDCDNSCTQRATCCSDYITYCMMAAPESDTTMVEKVTRPMTANRTYPNPPPLPPLPPFPFAETSTTSMLENSETTEFEMPEIPLIHYRPIRPPWAINLSTTEESNKRIPIPTEPTPLILNPYTITRKVFVKNVSQVPVYNTTTNKIPVPTTPTTKIFSFTIPKRPYVIHPEERKPIPTRTTTTTTTLMKFLNSTSKTTPIIMKQRPFLTVKTSTTSPKLPKFYPTKKPMTVPLRSNTTTKTTTTQTTTSTTTTRSTVQDSYTRSPNLEVTRDQQWIQARRGQKPQKKEAQSLSGIIAILVAVALVIAAIGIAGYFVVRNRKRERMQNRIADDSDVRFLTSDEILDFSLARPAENANEDL